MRKPLLDQDRKLVWQDRVDAWLRSGLSQKDFCEQKRLALSTFSLWRRRLKQQARPAALEIVPVPWVQPARLPASPLVVVVGSGRYRLEVAAGFQRETLDEVLQVLEARA